MYTNAVKTDNWISEYVDEIQLFVLKAVLVPSFFFFNLS